MKTQQVQKVTEQEIERFGDLITQGVECWVKAGELLVKMLDEDKEAMDKIARKYPTLSIPILNQLEMVGRKVLHEKLLMASGPGASALKHLPYSYQVRYLEEPVEMVILKDGKPDTLLIAVDALTSSQARQVFTSNNLRTPGEQRAWLEDQREKKVLESRPATLEAPYTIHRDGSVEFGVGVRMTIGDLSRIITELARK